MVLGDVLILVLMEDTLRAYKAIIDDLRKGLNPCSNGRYSQRQAVSFRSGRMTTS